MTTPSTTLATSIKFSSEFISSSVAMVRTILYLSAPGEDVLGVAPWLSKRAELSEEVITS